MQVFRLPVPGGLLQALHACNQQGQILFRRQAANE